MKGTKVKAVELVRRIRDRHARALAGKSAADIIAFYRAAGVAASHTEAPTARTRRSPAAKALQPTSRARPSATPTLRTRAARG